MTKLNMAGIGELLWDILPEGERLGGAPVNFTYHVTSLGAIGLAISTVGEDTRGNRALTELQRNGIETAAISSTKDFPTGFVTASIDTQGVASYSFPNTVAWDHLIVNKYAVQCVEKAHGVCFGTLAQRSTSSRKTIHRLLANCKPDTLKIFDINLRQHFFSKKIIEDSLKQCNVLKLNDDELQILSKMFDLSGADNEKLAVLRNFYNLDLAALTRGCSGSILLTKDDISSHPGLPAEIVDTIGAGDSFAASVAVGLLLKKDLNKINETANRIAAYVCSHPGAMVPVPEELKY